MISLLMKALTRGDIPGSFKKFPLLFRQAKTIVIIWLFDHFKSKTVPSMNGVSIITFINHLHAWATKFKPSFTFFKLPVLTSNNVIWVNFSATHNNTLSRHSRWATCLFAMRSSISLLSLKIFF